MKTEMKMNAADEMEMRSGTGREILIEAENITKTFRVYSDKSHTFKDRVLFRRRNEHDVKQVLKGISFHVEKGTALGLIGHNGCGKSTTLKLLNHIIYPDGGQIRMHGRISSLIELGAGFHPDMSGRENIYINATIFGLKRHEIDKRLDDIIRFSELEEFIDNPVRTYSSGMYMRLAFAIAINVDADILLVDEILAVGDVNFQKKCFDRLLELKKEGVSIVIVSHSMDQIRSVCDEVIWLEKGEIRESGEASVVCEEYLLQMRKAAEERAKKEAEQLQKERKDDPNTLFPPQKTALEQCSKYAHRNGTMAVRFEKLQMLGADGRPSQTFSYGESLRIKYRLTPDERADMGIDIIFNLFGHNDGHLCTTFGTRLAFDRFVSGTGAYDSWLEIPSVSLCEGSYILDALIENEAGEVLDRMTHLIEFTVKAPHKYGIGIAAMDNYWGFERRL